MPLQCLYGKGDVFFMDWFPLLNTVRTALVSTTIVFFLGIFAANRVLTLPRPARSALDALFTVPLVIPPTVTGWLILRFLGTRHPVGYWMQALFGVRLVMTWQSGVLAAVIVSFPLMYRMARGAFRRFDEDLSDAAQTLGHSELWTFWVIQIPVCGQEIFTGVMLAFARAAGEYGATSMVAGYTPGRTATVASTVYQMWRADESGAAGWVFVSIVLSAVFAVLLSLLENGFFHTRRRGEQNLQP